MTSNHTVCYRKVEDSKALTVQVRPKRKFTNEKLTTTTPSFACLFVKIINCLVVFEYGAFVLQVIEKYSLRGNRTLIAAIFPFFESRFIFSRTVLLLQYGSCRYSNPMQWTFEHLWFTCVIIFTMHLLVRVYDKSVPLLILIFPSPVNNYRIIVTCSFRWSGAFFVSNTIFGVNTKFYIRIDIFICIEAYLWKFFWSLL